MNIVRAKNTYMGKGFDEMPKTSTFYRTDLIVTDSFKDFPLYQRGKTKFFVDIPISTHDLGIIYKGYFILICRGNEYDLGIKKTLEKLSENLKSKNYSILDSAMKLIETYKGRK